MRLGRVLVAVDFSEAARAAFDYAVALSRRHGAELLVVHAVPADWPSRWHARERRELIGSLRAAAKASGVRFKISVQSGDPAGVIVPHATARRADAIVLGASARSGLDRFRFGSVAETVAAEATRPVMVVPAHVEASAPFKSILVAVDFSESSSAAVAQALAIAGEDTRVTVLHVVPGVPLTGASRSMYRMMQPDYQRHRALDAWRRIREILPANAPKLHARVAMGDPTAEISRVAREAGADLIVVGVTPRGPISRLLFGSTAARVIRSAGVPVLTMPQPAAPARAPLGEEDEFAGAA